MITWQDFEKIDIRVGTIIEAKLFEKAKKPAFQIWVDFGEIGILKSSAQITDLYNIDDLKNKQVVGIVNFPPKQIANFVSEFLILGVYNQNNEVILLTPDKSTQNGDKIG